MGRRSRSESESVVDPITWAVIFRVGFVAVVRRRGIILVGGGNKGDEDKDENAP